MASEEEVLVAVASVVEASEEVVTEVVLQVLDQVVEDHLLEEQVLKDPFPEDPVVITTMEDMVAIMDAMVDMVEAGVMVDGGVIDHGMAEDTGFGDHLMDPGTTHQSILAVDSSSSF